MGRYIDEQGGSLDSRRFLLVGAVCAIIAGFLVGRGCGQRGPATSISVQHDTVWEVKTITSHSVPVVVDSIPYSRPRQNGSVHNSRPVVTGSVPTTQPAADTSLVTKQYPVPAPPRLANILTDTFRDEHVTVATLDTVFDNRIIGRGWYVHYKMPTVINTVIKQAKQPLFTLYGGAHATTTPLGSFYGPDAAVSVRGNAIIYGNYTLVQNSTQFGVLIKLSR